MKTSSATIVAVLATVALFLAGCGGGGATTTTAPANECVNSKFDIKTQSFTGTGTITFKQDPAMTPIPGSLNGSAKIDSKVDMDNIAIREDFEATPTIQGKQQDIKTGIIFSYDKELLAAKNANSTFSKCGYMKLTGLKTKISLQQIKTDISILLTLINNVMPCNSNDGTYDTFDLSAAIPGPNIPKIPILDGVSAKVDGKIVCDKDLMLHAMSLTIDSKTPAKNIPPVHVPAEKTHVELNLPIDGGVGKSTGPTDADLDYTKWGECTEIPFPPPHGSVHAFFKEGRPDFAMASPATELILRAIDGFQERPQVEASVVV